MPQKMQINPTDKGGKWHFWCINKPVTPTIAKWSHISRKTWGTQTCQTEGIGVATMRMQEGDGKKRENLGGGKNSLVTQAVGTATVRVRSGGLLQTDVTVSRLQRSEARKIKKTFRGKILIN